MFKTSTLLAGLVGAIALAGPAFAENSDYNIIGPGTFVDDTYHAVTMDVGEHPDIAGIIVMAQMVGTCAHDTCVGGECTHDAPETMAASDADAMVPMMTDGEMIFVLNADMDLFDGAIFSEEPLLAYGAADDVFDTNGLKGSVFDAEVTLASFADFDKRAQELAPDHFMTVSLTSPGMTQDVSPGHAGTVEFIAANAQATTGPDATGVLTDQVFSVNA